MISEREHGGRSHRLGDRRDPEQCVAPHRRPAERHRARCRDMDRLTTGDSCNDAGHLALLDGATHNVIDPPERPALKPIAAAHPTSI